MKNISKVFLLSTAYTLLLGCTDVYAAQKISELPDGGAVQATDVFPITRSTSTYKAHMGGPVAYPATGIAVSTGSAWGSSITDNSTNWNNAYSSRISSVVGTAPISMVLSSNTITTSIAQAGTAASGYLSATDWNTFNNKLAASIAANSLLGNNTGSTANASAISMPSCSGATDALTWTTNSGFGCNTITEGGGTGSGTVNSGTQYQITYYGATGTVVSGSTSLYTNAAGYLGIGTSSPATGYALDASNTTGAIAIPVGTTGARPTGRNGALRYNSSLHRLEAYLNSVWTSISVGQNFVDVSLPPYSAVCDGSTDDTSVFNSALASGYKVLVPAKSSCCAVNNLVMPDNTEIQGQNPYPWYDVTTGTRSCITNTAAATTIINPNGKFRTTIKDIDVISRGATWGTNVQCIAGGGVDVNVLNSSIRFCGNGGLGASTQTYTNNLHSINSNWYANGNNIGEGAINAVIDSQITGGAITSSLLGIYLPSGADSNSVAGVRIEWNSGSGIVCSSCNQNVFTGNTFDANEDNAIKLTNSTAISITGNYFWRNGVTATAGNQAHIVSGGGNIDTAIVGNVFKKGYDDGGGGTQRPKYILEVTTSGDTGLTMVGNSATAGFVTNPFLFTANPTKALISNNSTGKVPTLSSCGTSPSITGTDEAGIITVGSGTVTACTITHGDPNWRTWSCLASTSANAYVYPSASSSTANTFTSSANMGASSLHYRCTH